MPNLDLQYDLANLTPANASPVQANFVRIETFINTDLINRDGTTAMTGQLQLVGDPAAPLDAAPKQYVDQVLPIGCIFMYGGAAAPAGGKWALCNGATLASSSYPELFSAISYTYGGSGGSFALPNLQGRFPLMVAGGYTIGSQAGSKDAVIVDHTHTINHDHPAGTTSTESDWHQHPGVDHLHGVNINTGIENNTHRHGMIGVNASGTVGPGFGLHYVADNNTLSGTYPYFGSTAAQDANHQHNVSGATGGADRSLTTGNQTVLHNHTFDVPNFGGSSGGAAGGVAGTDRNMPPYLVVNFIIRVL